MNLSDLIYGFSRLTHVFELQPSLRGVEIVSIKLNEYGNVTLLIDLKDFPSTPPDNWKKLGYETVYVRLGLSGVTKISVSGWTYGITGDLVVRQRSSHRIIDFANGGNDFSFYCEADVVSLNEFMPFLRGEE
ncbi:MAG: Imm50 family immunity protein [Planctomycetota bacterium]